LTATSLGNATGTVGVEVVVGGGVFEGRGVCVGVSVDKASVADGVIPVGVGVSVTGVFDGRLQADRVRTIVNTDNKLRDFITLSFGLSPSYTGMIPLTIDHLDSFSP